MDDPKNPITLDDDGSEGDAEREGEVSRREVLRHLLGVSAIVAGLFTLMSCEYDDWYDWYNSSWVDSAWDNSWSDYPDWIDSWSNF